MVAVSAAVLRSSSSKSALCSGSSSLACWSWCWTEPSVSVLSSSARALDLFEPGGSVRYY